MRILALQDLYLLFVKVVRWLIAEVMPSFGICSLHNLHPAFAADKLFSADSFNADAQSPRSIENGSALRYLAAPARGLKNNSVVHSTQNPPFQGFPSSASAPVRPLNARRLTSTALQKSCAGPCSCQHVRSYRVSIPQTGEPLCSLSSPQGFEHLHRLLEGHWAHCPPWCPLRTPRRSSR